MGDHFRKHDPNEERAVKFRRDMKLLMGKYGESHNSLIKSESQRLITEFVAKLTEPSIEHGF